MIEDENGEDWEKMGGIGITEIRLFFRRHTFIGVPAGIALTKIRDKELDDHLLNERASLVDSFAPWVLHVMLHASF